MSKLLSFSCTVLFIVAALCAQGQLSRSYQEIKNGALKDISENQTEVTFNFTVTAIPINIKPELFPEKSPNPIEPEEKDKTASTYTAVFNLSDAIKNLAENGSRIFELKENDAIIGSFTVIKKNNSVVANKAPAGPDLPIAFYDAQNIIEGLDKKDRPILPILAKYFDFKNTDCIESLKIVKANPFFTELLKDYNCTAESDALKAAGKGPSSSSVSANLLGNLAGIDVTKYVQATSDFLRDRVKEELAIAFIEKFKNSLESIPELKALLPKTYALFNASDMFKAPSLGKTFKTAFQEDLTNFAEQFELLINTNPKFNALSTSQALTAFRIAYHTIDLSANDMHPINIFEFLDARFGADGSAFRTEEINHYVSLLNILSQNLRKKGKTSAAEDGWVDVDDLRTFDPKAILPFWGLLYQQKKDVFDKLMVNKKTFKDLLIESSHPMQMHTTQVYLKQFVVLSQNIDQRIKAFKDAVKKSREEGGNLKQNAVESFVANADKILEIADFVFSLPYFKSDLGQSFYQSDYYTKWRPVIVDVVETTKGVYAKDFAKISVNATSLIGHLSQLHGNNLFTENFQENFTYYTNFLVDAINADSANDVKAVINRYAEPVRSYRVKRRTNFDVSLNAYPGLYFGSERTQGKIQEKARAFGVTAPIGFSFNHGNKKGLSKSIFLSAVDIAAALSFRWNNDTLDLPEKITLGQIFSPGAYFVLGFPNVPISAKAGLQYVPQLRSITTDGNTVNEVSVVRFGVSAVVDVPVFNFRNRKRQVYK